jgi:hypothetical protein
MVGCSREDNHQAVPIFLRLGIGTYIPWYKAYCHVTPDRPGSHRYHTVASSGAHLFVPGVVGNSSLAVSIEY